MAMTENLVSGKKYRILTNAANDVWDRISFWTKASDVYYNDNTTAEANKPAAMLKRSTAYTVGTIAFETTAPSWVLLRCTTAGTTAASVPSTYSTISSVGATITDGTAKFAVYDARPTTTLSTSAYQIPAMSLVNSLNAELTANSKKFYFDYQNSKYGYNTDSARGASTFVPFGGSGILVNGCSYCTSGYAVAYTYFSDSETAFRKTGGGAFSTVTHESDGISILYTHSSSNGTMTIKVTNNTGSQITVTLLDGTTYNVANGATSSAITISQTCYTITH